MTVSQNFSVQITPITCFVNSPSAKRVLMSLAVQVEKEGHIHTVPQRAILGISTVT